MGSGPVGGEHGPGTAAVAVIARLIVRSTLGGQVRSYSRAGAQGEVNTLPVKDILCDHERVGRTEQAIGIIRTECDRGRGF